MHGGGGLVSEYGVCVWEVVGEKGLNLVYIIWSVFREHFGTQCTFMIYTIET